MMVMGHAGGHKYCVLPVAGGCHRSALGVWFCAMWYVRGQRREGGFAATLQPALLAATGCQAVVL
jgi:hypothetical protein